MDSQPLVRNVMPDPDAQSRVEEFNRVRLRLKTSPIPRYNFTRS